jgi:2-keto-3-deoxy-L-rhamnonate aldolase RhmA
MKNLTAIDEEVLLLSDAVRAAASRNTCAADVVAGSGLEWVLSQALDGNHLPMNEATVQSLRHVLRLITDAPLREAS